MRLHLSSRARRAVSALVLLLMTPGIRRIAHGAPASHGDYDAPILYRAGPIRNGPDVLKHAAKSTTPRARTQDDIPPVMDDVATMIAFADTQKAEEGAGGT